VCTFLSTPAVYFVISFDTVLHNAKVSFCARLKCAKNGLFDVLGLH